MKEKKGDGSGGGAAVRWGHQRIHLSDGHQQGDTYNAVQLYHAGRKEIERKAWKVENAEKVKKWGRLQYYKRAPLHDEQRTAEGAGRTYFEGKMQSGEKADGGEHQRGCAMLFAGNTIWLEIPRTGGKSLQGQVLIERGTHIFEEGAHRMQMDIRIEEVGNGFERLFEGKQRISENRRVHISPCFRRTARRCSGSCVR